MNNRADRKKIAEDTLKILEQGYFTAPSGKKVEISELQKKAVLGTKLYTPKASDEILKNRSFKDLETSTIIEVTNQTTLDATKMLIAEGHKDVLSLNFASAKNPGGGFLGGSQAQEESIARSTGLYKCQVHAFEYYEANRVIKSCIYTDHMIYSPYVPIIKNEEGINLEEAVYCGIITAPAVNAGIVRKKEPEKIAQIEVVMKRRIRKVLSISLENNHKTLVLGAWGCGVFQNNPKDIAKYFKEALETEYKNCFERIIFAIYAKNERFIKPFQEEFEDT